MTDPGFSPCEMSKNAHTVPQRDHPSRADFRLRRHYAVLLVGAPTCCHGYHEGRHQRGKRVEGESEMAETPGGDSNTSRNTKRRARNPPANQQANAPDLAAERDSLWDASARS